MEYTKCEAYPQCMGYKCECMETACMIQTTEKLITEGKNKKKIPVIRNVNDIRKELKKQNGRKNS